MTQIPLFAMCTYGDNTRTHAMRQGGGKLCNTTEGRKLLRPTYPAPPAARPDCIQCQLILDLWLHTHATQVETAKAA